MRVAAISGLSMLVALLLAYLAWVQLDGGDPDPEPPARKIAEALDPDKPVANPWSPEHAAKINYDRQSKHFFLANVSPHFVWYVGDGGPDPFAFYQRQLPMGEWVQCNAACKQNVQLVPLAPGRQVAFGWFEGTPRWFSDTPTPDWAKLDAMPARVSVKVYAPAPAGVVDKPGAKIYSDPVILAR